MRDAEILLRYLAYRNFIASYTGNLKYFLDEATRKLTAAWDTRENEMREQVEGMERALAFTREAFGDRDYLRKWNGQNFESKKNRAVFDIMLHYFSKSDVRDALAARKNEIKERFIALCGNDDFRTSLETTTKSIDANRVRFNKWGEVIEELSGISLSELKFPS